MRKKMTLEQMDHFLRHIALHAEELRQNDFQKGPEYIQKLKEAQALAADVSHDMIHVMRVKKFQGYENADFVFYTDCPEDLEHHQFREFDVTSFRVGCKLKATLDLEMVEEKNIILTLEQAEEQLEVLGNAIQDAEVLIKMLEEYFE